MNFKALAALVLIAASCTHKPMVKTLPPIPDAAYAKGVSAPFCGVLDGTLIVAGGANFPEKSLLEGGPKRVYKDIWALKADGWERIGELPDSTAYGATFSLPGRLILAGGSVCGTTTDKVYELSADGLRQMDALPFPVEQAGAAILDDVLYLAGGSSVLEFRDGEWEEIAPLPEPLTQPVAYARDGKLFVWGGFNPGSLLAPSEGFCLDLETLEWADAPAIPDGGTFTGATGAVLQDGRLIVVGGVNKAIFERALRNTPEDRIPYLSKEPAEYRFRTQVFIFDGTSWTLFADIPEAALAGPGVAVHGSTVYVSGGELKPGVRSPLTFSFDVL